MLKKEEETLGYLIKKARIEKGLSARKLAELCDISHTEINNIESGLREKPAILTLKGFEKYLDLDFTKLAKLAGYSEDTIKYGEKNVIVSYETYDKVIQEYRDEIKHILFKLDQKRHLGMDIREYLDVIREYIDKQDNVDEVVIKKLDAIYTLLDQIESKYESLRKEQ